MMIFFLPAKQNTFRHGNNSWCLHVSGAPFLSAVSANSNSVAVAYTDDGDPYNGRGGALYNYGSDGTVVFKGLAIFKDNVGEMVRRHIS